MRGAAVWALGQLIAREEFESLKSRTIATESDESVREEWTLVS